MNMGWFVDVGRVETELVTFNNNGWHKFGSSGKIVRVIDTIIFAYCQTSPDDFWLIGNNVFAVSAQRLFNRIYNIN